MSAPRRCPARAREALARRARGEPPERAGEQIAQRARLAPVEIERSDAVEVSARNDHAHLVVGAEALVRAQVPRRCAEAAKQHDSIAHDGRSASTYHCATRKLRRASARQPVQQSRAVQCRMRGLAHSPAGRLDGGEDVTPREPPQVRRVPMAHSV